MLDNRIDDLFSDYLYDLKLLIKHESVFSDTDQYPFGKGIQGGLEEVVNIAGRLGYNTFIDPEGYYAYAEIGTGTELFGVLGHIDVVPAGDRDLWNTDPFLLSDDGEYLYGRGVADDKGPVLTSMYALKLCLDEGLELNQRIRFIFGTDEESLWRCMNAYVAKEEVPSKGFTPDAGFPLIYAEKGLIQFNLFDDSIVDAGLNGGNAYNAVPDESVIPYSKAYEEMAKSLNIPYEVKNNMMYIKGVAKHAMAADEGINANALAASIIQLDQSNNLVKFIVERGSHPNGEQIYGDLKDDVSGKLMFNLAIVSGNKIGIDMRFPVTVPKDLIVDNMKEVAKTYNLRVEEYDYLRSIYMDRDSEYIQTLMNIYKEETGDNQAEPISSGGATYARAMDNIVAFGPGFAGHEQFEHEANERVLISDIKKAMKIYYRTFKEIVFK